MNNDRYFVYGWAELPDKIIDNNWLIKNKIKIYTFKNECNNLEYIYYGLECKFINKIGKIKINNKKKKIVKIAFNNFKENNPSYKLEYFIGLKCDVKYYDTYNQNCNNFDYKYTYTELLKIIISIAIVIMVVFISIIIQIIVFLTVIIQIISFMKLFNRLIFY